MATTGVIIADSSRSCPRNAAEANCWSPLYKKYTHHYPCISCKIYHEQLNYQPRRLSWEHEIKFYYRTILSDRNSLPKFPETSRYCRSDALSGSITEPALQPQSRVYPYPLPLLTSPNPHEDSVSCLLAGRGDGFSNHQPLNRPGSKLASV